MKARPTSNYPVRMVRETDEVPDSHARIYEGIYTVVLNETVRVAFVPDVSTVAPPWDRRLLPDDLDLVSTPEQARIEMVLFSSYAVTPNARLAGEVERVPDVQASANAEGAASAQSRPTWVRYVEPAQFDRMAAELPRLFEVVLSGFRHLRVNDLMEFEVVRFLTEEIVPAPWLNPYHATMLGRGEPGGPR